MLIEKRCNRSITFPSNQTHNHLAVEKKTVKIMIATIQNIASWWWVLQWAFSSVKNKFCDMLSSLYKSRSCCMHKNILILNICTLTDRSPGNQKCCSLQIRPIRHIRLDILNIYVIVTQWEKLLSRYILRVCFKKDFKSSPAGFTLDSRHCDGLDFEATFWDSVKNYYIRGEKTMAYLQCLCICGGD